MNIGDNFARPLPTLGPRQSAGQGVLDFFLRESMHIVADIQLRDSQKVALIDAVVNTENTTASVETQIDEFKKNVTKLQQGQEYFTLPESHSLKLQHRVADIVRQIQFAPNCSLPILSKALQHYQQNDGKIDKSAPVDFLSAEQRAGLDSIGNPGIQ